MAQRKEYRCLDCGTEISHGGIRCRSCATNYWRSRQPTTAERLGIKLPNPSGLCQCGCGQPTPIAKTTVKDRGVVRGHPIRFIHGHHHQKFRPYYEIEDRGYATPCWVWKGYVGPGGYAYIGTKAMYRRYYEQAKGPIPDGLVIDHLCRVSLCVNPDHLEAVTEAVNVQRGNLAKLTVDQVKEIRASPLGAMELSRRYGVAREHIWVVRTRKVWKNV